MQTQAKRLHPIKTKIVKRSEAFASNKNKNRKTKRSSSFSSEESEGSITEDFIGCKRFASSFSSEESEGSITEDFIGCKRFASSFSSQQSEDSSQKIQGVDEKVQKSKEKDDFNEKQGVAFNLS